MSQPSFRLQFGSAYTLTRADGSMQKAHGQRATRTVGILIVSQTSHKGNWMPAEDGPAQSHDLSSLCGRTQAV